MLPSCKLMKGSKKQRCKKETKTKFKSQKERLLRDPLTSKRKKREDHPFGKKKKKNKKGEGGKGQKSDDLNLYAPLSILGKCG